MKSSNIINSNNLNQPPLTQLENKAIFKNNSFLSFNNDKLDLLIEKNKITIDSSTIRNLYLIENIQQTIKIVETVLKYQSIIAFDCEGIFLSKDGQLTLIQIALENGDVYIFDILKGGSLMFSGYDCFNQGLKSILESSKILKIVHDCRSDWESLLYQYEIRIHNFIDSQELYFVYKLIFFQDVVKPISLSNMIKEINGNELIYKQKMKKKMFENPELWGERPLSSDSLLYASEDVVYLVHTWFIFKNIINENLLEMVYFISILKVVNKSLYLQFTDQLISSVILLVNTQKESELAGNRNVKIEDSTKISPTPTNCNEINAMKSDIKNNFYNDDLNKADAIDIFDLNSNNDQENEEIIEEMIDKEIEEISKIELNSINNIDKTILSEKSAIKEVNNDEFSDKIQDKIKTNTINTNINSLARYLMDFDFVDYFFQIKSIPKVNQNIYYDSHVFEFSKNKDDSSPLSQNSYSFDDESKSIINMCLSYKNMQREFFNSLYNKK